MKNTTNTTFAVFGNGPIARALTSGLIATGTLPENITVMKETPDSDLSFFHKQQVHCDNHSTAHTARYIILAGLSSNAGPTLNKLNEIIKLDPMKSPQSQQAIISCVPRLFIQSIREHLMIPQGRIVQMVSNTNIAYGTGVMSVSNIDRHDKNNLSQDIAALFSPLGKIVYESSKEAAKSLTTIYWANAMDTMSLKFFYIKLVKDYMQVDDWISILQRVFNANGKLPENCSVLGYRILHAYLIAKTTALYKLGYSSENAISRSLETFKSTLNTLVATKAASIADLDAYMVPEVVPNNEFLDELVEELNYIQKLQHSHRLGNLFLNMHRRANGFSDDVRNSLQSLQTV